MNILEQAAANKRASWVVISFVILLFLCIGFGFDYFYGSGMQFPVFTGVAFLFGVGSSYMSFAYGDKMILSSTHAVPLDMNDPKQQQWHNIIEEMSIAAGIPVPKTYIIDDPDPNAFATGQDPEHSSIAVTRGLLEALNRDELQGVAAHEMSHIKNFDIRLMLILAVMVGAIALLADWAGRSLWFGRSRSSRRSEGSGPIALIILAVWFIAIILAPILSQLMAMAVSRKRESLADASGAALTRNPLGLASALEKINGYTSPTRSINQGTAHLCIADPKGSAVGMREDWMGNLFATHPPIEKRIRALKEMAYQFNASKGE
ncbi:MAG TPA: M48 family metallopeptidase [Candidatus Omnitrophota bacterium]|nr:M48 family metallopeptidase [Candidatus Omnitrophota bacterium]HPT06549.1 M48 family metallopeptidase [Candidatus Omnitrophota bacterium]